MQLTNTSHLKTYLMHHEDQIKPKPKPRSLTSRLYSLLCPCLIHKYAQQSLQEQSSNYHEETNSQFPETAHQDVRPMIDIKPKGRNETQQNLGTGIGMGEKGKNPIFQKSLTEVSGKQEDHDKSKSMDKIWLSYPIFKYKQNQLFALGNSEGKLLAKISTVRTQPSASSKKSFLNSKASRQSQTCKNQTNLDKYWNKRYFMFEKFEEGISINQQSWPNIIPEAVCEHISSQIKCDIVLDVFCGVGCNSLKLANTCKRVISMDSKMENLKCLYINKQICEKDNIQILNREEYNNISCEPNALLITNNYDLQEKLSSQSVSLQQLNHEFTTLLSLSFSFCHNVIAILPPNIDVQSVASFISSALIGHNLKTQSCCLKIQKVFYGQKLKCIVVYFGQMINSVTINQELHWIYEQLNQNTSKQFQHKKLIKEIRQSVGMIRLFSLLLQSNASISPSPKIHPFLKLLKSKAVITQPQYDYFISNKHHNHESHSQQPHQQDSPKSQDQYETERTNSFFSSVDHPDQHLQNSRNQEIEIIGGSQCQSNSIVGQRSTFSIKSTNLTKFPNLPGRKTFGIQEVQEANNRQSDVVEFMKLNIH